MTTRPSRLGAVSYATESAFAEDSSSFGTRLLPLNPVDVSKIRRMVQEVPILQQRLHEGIAHVPTIWAEGEVFSLEFLLAGHGGTAAGALTATDLATFLGYVFGALRTADVGTTAQASGSATALELAGGTQIAGTLLRVGERADARGGGHFYAVGAVGANPEATLLTAMPAAANAADVVYAAQILHPVETGDENVQTLRFRLLTANEHWDVFGCAPVSIAITQTNPAEVPRIRVGFSMAWARPVSGGATFPATASTDMKAGSVIANGSFFGQVAGTTTRRTWNIRQLSIEIRNQVEQLRGLGGAIAGQGVTKVVRTRCDMGIRAVIDAEASGTRTLYDEFAAGSFWHILWSASIEDGRALGIYVPRARFREQPAQIDQSNLNCVEVAWDTLTNSTVTTPLVASNFRIALG